MKIFNVLDYFEMSYRRYPNKIAVSDEKEFYTFSELRKKALNTAESIQTGEINQPIGFFANRSVQSVVYILAILYSGNYYVPLDPSLPAEKLQNIIDETEFKCILGAELAENGYFKEIVNDGHINESTDFLTINETLSWKDVGDNDPAYMIYTSGSTGKPKGVIKSHSAIYSYIEAFCDTFSFFDSEVIGNQTPFFFDASSKDFYLMLKIGAELHIIPTEKFSMSTELVEYMNLQKISYICWVPTAISLVAQMNPFSLVMPEYLHRLFFVGENMPVKYLNVWRNALPSLEYVNLYGQSELAGIGCYYVVSKDFNDEVIPIGKPLKNCILYLLDGDAIITEPYKTGELYIVSDALALGYFRDEDRTNQSFLLKDFGNGKVRCFRTGDLAYYDISGDLIYVSRYDSQIKHMGHRVELGEIETVANSLTQIENCCCLYNSAKKKIVMFCKTREEITEQEIKKSLKNKLSPYMVPGYVKILDELPKNANGKIDRQLLKSFL